LPRIDDRRRRGIPHQTVPSGRRRGDAGTPRRALCGDGVRDRLSVWQSVRERALALIEIAHPDFRESLLDEAKRQSLVPATHRLGGGQGYLVEEERVVQLKSGSKVM